MAVRLDEIETEVVYIILEYVVNSSPHTSLSLLLTNKFLNTAVKAIRNHRKTFTLRTTIQDSFDRHAWAFDKEVLASLRHLTVKHRGPWECNDAGFEQRFEVFNDFIKRIKNLKSFTWSAGPVPHTLLSTLRTAHPTAMLKVLKFARFQCGLTCLDKSENDLSRYPTLIHLIASGSRSTRFLRLTPTSEHLNSGPDNYNFATAVNIIGSSRSLEYVGIVLLHDFPPDMQEFPEGEIDNANVKKSKKHRRCNTLKHLTIDGSQLRLSKEFLEHLDVYLDISKLEKLKFSRGFIESSYFQHATTMLPNLKHVSLNCAAFLREHPSFDVQQKLNPIGRAAREYLLACRPLQTLSLWSWVNVIKVCDLLDRHGSSLEALQLHQKEPNADADISNNRPVMDARLTLADMCLIRQSCLKLRDLTVDVDRHDLPLDISMQQNVSSILDELARFDPPLMKTQLYINSTGIYKFLEGTSVFSFEGDGNAEERPSERELESVMDVPDILTARVIDPSHQEDPLGQYQAVDNGEVQVRHVSDSHLTNNTTSPSKKRVWDEEKTEYWERRESREQIMQEYVESIWKRIYGRAEYGERMLDVKIGEWESKHAFGPNHDNPTMNRMYKVRPHERDDMGRECVVGVFKRLSREPPDPFAITC